MALSAFIFDVDGTLIDTNHAHVQAWHLALKQHGYEVSPDRIAVEIGKGGDKLIPSILGEEVNRRDGKSLTEARGREFTKIARSRHLPPFAGVRELLEMIRRRGLKLAIATSSSKKDLQTLQDSSGLDLTAIFDVIATGDDAADSKPAPGIVSAAVQKLNMAATQCVMVGDTPYDSDSARDGGMVCLGFTCGGLNDEKTLRATGMRAVYRDPADLAANLDAALQIASPGSATMTQEMIDALMREALQVARDGLEHGEVPIGCVIALGNGTIVARGHNELNASQNKIAHAEITAFNRLAGLVSPDARDLILVSTLEPCVMCLGASMEAAVDTILYGMHAPTDGGRTRVRPPVSPESQMPRIVGDQMAGESRKLLGEFLKRKPSNPTQEKFVRQLLQAENE